MLNYRVTETSIWSVNNSWSHKLQKFEYVIFGRFQNKNERKKTKNVLCLIRRDLQVGSKCRAKNALSFLCFLQTFTKLHIRVFSSKTWEKAPQVNLVTPKIFGSRNGSADGRSDWQVQKYILPFTRRIPNIRPQAIFPLTGCHIKRDA